MKRFIFSSLFLLFLSCDDGDIQIESINFDETDLQQCATDSDEKLASTFFFKIEEDESLLLTLESGQFENSTSAEAITSTLAATGTPSLIYRFFSGDVTTDYFCSEVPALEPMVVKENTATGGTVEIMTEVSAVSGTSKTYTHTITISDLSLINDLGERLTDTSTLQFGRFTTDTDNSAGLEAPFSNYDAIETGVCETIPSDGNVRLYKILNDEYIALDIPVALLANSATGETPRTAPLASDVVFRNIVLRGIATEEIACSANIDSETTEGYYESTEGTISVTTVANAPGEDGISTFTHTITLENMGLTLLDPTDTSDTTTLDVITSVSFGTITTTPN